MGAGRKLKVSVCLATPVGAGDAGFRTFHAGETLPDWATDLVGDHVYEDAPTRAAALTQQEKDDRAAAEARATEDSRKAAEEQARIAGGLSATQVDALNPDATVDLQPLTAAERKEKARVAKEQERADAEAAEAARKLAEEQAKTAGGQSAAGGDGGQGGNVEIPPRGGAGSGIDEWTAYAASLGVAVPEDAKRDDVIAALEQAGHPVTRPES